MPEQTNFLLGFGERLTERVAPSGGGNETKPAYEMTVARDLLVPQLQEAADIFDDLPEGACPGNAAVAVVTLHPQSLSKSAYPGTLLNAVGLRTIGSRPVRVTPRQWTRKGEPRESESTALFVAGDRRLFRNWSDELGQWNTKERGAGDLAKVELIRAGGPADRIRPVPESVEEPLLEVALHAGPRDSVVLEAFDAYTSALGMKADLDRRLYAGQLCFMPVQGLRERMDALGQFTFLRVARPMPSLRPVGPPLRSRTRSTFRCELPEEDPVDPDLRVAIFDGGVPENHSLARWVSSHDAGDVGAPRDDYVEHGSQVSSALLFGSVEAGSKIPRPFSHVDHFRVLDGDSSRDEDLFDVLGRLRDVIQSNRHELLNLSLGPRIPIEDDDVHVWTSVLDDLLSDGERLLTVATGNDGDGDVASGNCRVQVPADSVNAMAIGAADSDGQSWSRAAYSSFGPGRSPGLVKPDALAFGGAESRPFGFVDAVDGSKSDSGCGTSFAAPAALRMASGIRAHFGQRLSPLAIKALLVHAAEEGGCERVEAGWGRIPSSLEDFVVCPQGTARIVYQGELSPAQYLRAPIPLPPEQLQGKVELKATLCYATPVDAAHPGNYTQAGLEVVFVPHDGRFNENSPTPDKLKSDSFFQLKEFSTEQELRHQAHKWETTLHRERKVKYGSSLSNPFFTIHYNAREGGAPAREADRIRYALVVTVASPRTPDLYDRIVRRYATQIQPLSPRVQIPVRTSLR